MARALIAFAIVVLAGCASDRPPAELSGLWSAGQASCEAGVGVRFRSGRIEAVYDTEGEVLFERPRYELLESHGNVFRVRIEYKLPHRPGGARSGARGELVLARDAGGRLVPESHTILDARTGAARLRIEGDPAIALMTLEPCGEHPWRGGLRGTTDA